MPNGQDEQEAQHSGRFGKLPPEVHDDLAEWLAHTCGAQADANSDGPHSKTDATDSHAKDEAAGNASRHERASVENGEADTEAAAAKDDHRPFTAGAAQAQAAHAGFAATQADGQPRPTGSLRPVCRLKSKAGEATDLLEDDAGNRFVRKRFPRHDRSLRETYQALVAMRGAHLARVYSVTETAEGIEVVRAYVPGPTLRDWVGEHGPVGDAQARAMLAQVATGVRQLHACQPPIIHRDINPNNIVMGPDGPQLIDFGIARPFDPGADRDTHTWGTHGYAAPEQFGFGQSDARTDVFALGMLYWFLLTGTDPDANLHARLTQMAPDDELAQNIPAGAREIICECVAIAPERRFANVDALTTALQAPVTEPEAAVEPPSAPVATMPPTDSPARRAPDRQGETASQAKPGAMGTGAWAGVKRGDAPEKPAAGKMPGFGNEPPAATAAAGTGGGNHPATGQAAATAAGTAERGNPAHAGTDANAAHQTRAEQRRGNRANPSAEPSATSQARTVHRSRRKPARTIPGKIWFIVSSACMGLLTIGALAFICEPWRFAYPEALVRALVACLGMLLFFGGTWLVTANPLGFRDRVRWFRAHTMRRCILFAVGGMVIGTLIIAAACSGLSPEYLQVMQQNGSSSV